MLLAKLVNINKLRSVTGEDNGTMVISDQDLLLDRASYPLFTWERSGQALI